MANPVLHFPVRFPARPARADSLARQLAVPELPGISDTQAAAIRIAAEVEQEMLLRLGGPPPRRGLHTATGADFELPTVRDALRTLVHVVRLRVSRRLQRRA